jgi:hydrogenase maturation protein HypF
VLNSTAGLLVEVEGAQEQLRCFERRMETERPPAAVVLAREISRLAPQDIADLRSGRVTPLGLRPRACCLTSPPAQSARRNSSTHEPAHSLSVHQLHKVRAAVHDHRRHPIRSLRLGDAEIQAVHRVRGQVRRAAGPQISRTAKRLSHMRSEASSFNGCLRGARTSRGPHRGVKGIGGFQLLVDARSPEAVARLRRRKHREEKPFAVMMPSSSRIPRKVSWNHRRRRSYC